MMDPAIIAICGMPIGNYIGTGIEVARSPVYIPDSILTGIAAGPCKDARFQLCPDEINGSRVAAETVDEAIRVGEDGLRHLTHPGAKNA